MLEQPLWHTTLSSAVHKVLGVYWGLQQRTRWPCAVSGFRPWPYLSTPVHSSSTQ